jgi:hypothetical protein
VTLGTWLRGSSNRSSTDNGSELIKPQNTQEASRQRLAFWHLGTKLG